MRLRSKAFGFCIMALVIGLNGTTAQAESMLFMDNFTGNGMGELYVGPTGSASIAPFTTWSSTSKGRIWIGPGLVMDTNASGQYNLNEADLLLDLTGYEDIRITVNHYSANDEVDKFDRSGGEYVPFDDHYAADGIAVSVDGENFVPLWSPSNSEQKNRWYSVSIDDVDDAINRALALSTSGSLSTVTFRLQQYDNYGYPTDGRKWDWFTIYGAEGDGPGPAPSVPEPSSLVLLGLGSIGLLGAYRQQRKRKAKRK